MPVPISYRFWPALWGLEARDGAVRLKLAWAEDVRIP
jgi:hypothetical protein